MIHTILHELQHAAIHNITTLIVAFVVARVLKLGRKLKQHEATQRKIADQLDTSTPGGLTDVLQAVNRQTEVERRLLNPED